MTGVSATQLYRTIQRIGAHTVDWLADLKKQGIDRLSDRERAKLRDLTPHVFRHTCATLRINILDESIRSVRNHLGHASIQMTERYEERGRGSRVDPGVALARLRATWLPGKESDGCRDEFIYPQIP